ncbi:MAG: hypothetical protein NC429_02735 [Lachnospiraceae bacterium]|nr:hypothetical protein [Lachnospiraceae bacterium]
MSKIKNLFAKKVDERQEMDLLKVEHYSFWLMYYLLIIEMIIQGIILDGGNKIIGEWIVFMIVSAFALAGWIRKGVWSYQSRKVPGVKSYLWYSLLTAVLGGILGFLRGWKRNAGNIPALMLNVVSAAVCSFAGAFLLFLIGGGIAKKREKKLEMEAVADEEE